MFAGRKLLVADDSPYYRTVIGLTFTDEGMEVRTAEDGRQALEIIEQSVPDVILASVSMPAVSGYELCRLLKQSERFGHIPVMLLVGLHENFDQAEARRVGADDIVTKPFQSIRELVGRVGSLLGGKPAGTDGSDGHGHSTLGLDGSERSEPAEHSEIAPDPDPVRVAENDDATDANVFVPEANEPPAPDEHNMSDVKVFVEAPLMAEHEQLEPASEPPGIACVADVALQTADTQKLERIDDEPEPEAPIDYAQADTMELPAVRAMEPAPRETAPAVEERQLVVPPEKSLDTTVQVAIPADVSAIGTPEMNEQRTTQTAPLPTPSVFSEVLLDLGDFDNPTQVTNREDLVLDLDYEEPVPVSVVPEMVVEAAPAFAAVAPAEAVIAEHVPSHEEQHVAELHEWSIVTDAPAEVTPVEVTPVILAEDQKPTDSTMALSPELIDAVARRAVELLSEKVLREIAWDVVPELAELLIKQKLEEQK
ncbi:MAG TPA: response regulator [Pyrinomonadaceae bacterium]|nr:response regulator [Pyrinomonadaceae bacterium]